VRENDSAVERQEENEGRIQELYRVRDVKRRTAGAESAVDPARDETVPGCCQREDDGRGGAGRKVAE
jgi:hypothetical protein